MNKKILFVVLASIVLPTNAWPLDETTEPPQAHSLEINGQAYPIELGKPVILSGAFTNPTVKLAAAATRHFAKAGIEFDYPASFTWEADVEQQETKSWTLSGNDFKIMVFSLGVKITADSYAKLLVKKFGAEKTRVLPTERKLGQFTYPGRLLTTTLSDTAISQEIFELSSQSASQLIVFQDTPPEGKGVSSEAQAALKVVTASFEIKR
jgi:hypothetical protein